jgi:hypothetical protein
MGSISSVSGNYDFKAARDRILYLTQLYRVGIKLCPEDQEWGWDLIAQIEELEREIAEVHQASNGKMTTLHGGHSVMHFEKIITPIIPAWDTENKREQTKC